MIVFDSSTLILTAKIELLDLFLADIKLDAVVPSAVERECCEAKKTLDSLLIQKAIKEGRVRAMSLRNRALVDRVQVDFGLGTGEAETIALAVREKATLVAIDDKNGINACKFSGIPFITALGILVRMRQKGLLDLERALVQLAALSRYGRYAKSLTDDAKARMEAPQ